MNASSVIVCQRTGNLTRRLRDTLNLAIQRRGQRFEFVLSKGLSVILYVDGDGANHLAIARFAPTWPSEAEWRTVLQHWPQPNTPLELPAERKQDPRRRYLTGAWKPDVPVFGSGS